jgi:hypothetical protein
MVGPVTERVLSSRELNRALLARQLLLERSTLPIPRALERVGGLQTQHAPSAYIGLWSRLRDFRRQSLTTALDRRRVVQATMMRVTIHMASPRDYWLFAAGTRRARRDWWLRASSRPLEGTEMEAVAARIREHLAGGPRRATEVKRLLRADGFPDAAWSGGRLWVDLVRVPPSGTWEQRRADLYGLADDWVPGPKPTEEEGLRHLIRRYLGGFGPASVSDISSWAGVPVTRLAPMVEQLSLRRFRDESGRPLLDLPRAPLPEGDAPAPVRFLPTWDATLLVHARRTQILAEAHRPIVFNSKSPQSVSTFLAGGRVAGTWRYEGGRVRIEPFDPLPRQVRRELEEEATGLAALHVD